MHWFAKCPGGTPWLSRQKWAFGLKDDCDNFPLAISPYCVRICHLCTTRYILQETRMRFNRSTTLLCRIRNGNVRLPCMFNFTATWWRTFAKLTYKSPAIRRVLFCRGTVSCTRRRQKKKYEEADWRRKDMSCSSGCRVREPSQRDTLQTFDWIWHDFLSSWDAGHWMLYFTWEKVLRLNRQRSRLVYVCIVIWVCQ